MVDVEKFEEGRRLHPLTLVHGSLISIPALVILGLPLLRGGNIYTSLLYLFFFLVVSVPIWLAQYLRFRYWITPKEIVIRSGVFTTQHRNIPIERVQNIEIQRNVIARVMGLAKVQIQTAGSSTTEGVLEYVSVKEANEIREVVRAYKRHVVGKGADVAPADAESGDEALLHPFASQDVPAGDGPTTRVLFSMAFPRVVLAGMFRLSLVYIVIFFSAIQYLNIDIDEIIDWILLGRSGYAATMAEASPFVVAVVTMVVVTLLAWISAIFLTINRFYRFELSHGEEKLHLRYGLMTLAERTLPLRRVQAVVIRSNPLMRSFGWYRVEIQMMGLEAETRGRHVVVPFARWHEIQQVLPVIYPAVLPETFTSVSGKTVRRVTIRATIFIGMVTAALYFVWSESWWLAALLPFGFYFAWCHYRNHGFVLDEKTYFLRRGVFREHLWIIPIERFQAFYLQSSFFQRRLGLRSVYVDTAGVSGSMPVLSDVTADVAEDLSTALLERFQGRSAAEPEVTEDASTFPHQWEVPPR
jgi:putative membrane protein